MSRMLIVSGSSLILLALVGLFGLHGDSSGRALDHHVGAHLYGADYGKYFVQGDCALKSLQGSEVPALGGCIGATYPTPCLICDGGYYNSHQTKDNGLINVQKGGPVNCAAMPALVGTCHPTNGECEDEVEQGFCEGTDFNYPYQAAP